MTLPTRSKLHTLRALIAASVLAAGQASAASLLVNGGFENGVYADNGSGFQRLSTTDTPTAIVGWTVSSENLAWIPASSGLKLTPSQGNYSLDLTGTSDNGTTFGAIRQSFGTIIGETYHVSFDVGLNNPTYFGPVKVRVDVAGVQQSFETSAAPGAGQHWEVFAMDFTATAAHTSLEFRGVPSNGGNRFYVGLDNVVVTGVPEPETYALILSGLGLVSFVARRRTRHETAPARL